MTIFAVSGLDGRFFRKIIYNIYIQHDRYF